MKTNEKIIGYIAIMKVQEKMVVVALPYHEDLETIKEHFQALYAAVIVDIRDIWVN